MLATFDERCAKLIADHSVAKKEKGIERDSIVQIGPKVHGNGTKWKELADRAEADKHTLYKFLDGQALFTGLFHMYTTTYKELRDSLQPSSKESG
jgi:hypothetical protein